MSNTYCVVFYFVRLCLVYPMLPVVLDCPFLITPSVFSNVYVFLILEYTIKVIREMRRAH